MGNFLCSKNVYKVKYIENDNVITSCSCFTDYEKAHKCAVNQVIKIYRGRYNKDPDIDEINRNLSSWAVKNLNIDIRIVPFTVADDVNDIFFMTEKQTERKIIE